MHLFREEDTKHHLSHLSARIIAIPASSITIPVIIDRIPSPSYIRYLNHKYET